MVTGVSDCCYDVVVVVTLPLDSLLPLVWCQPTAGTSPSHNTIVTISTSVHTQPGHHPGYDPLSRQGGPGPADTDTGVGSD